MQQGSVSGSRAVNQTGAQMPPARDVPPGAVRTTGARMLALQAARAEDRARAEIQDQPGVEARERLTTHTRRMRRLKFEAQLRQHAQDVAAAAAATRANVGPVAQAVPSSPASATGSPTGLPGLRGQAGAAGQARPSAPASGAGQPLPRDVASGSGQPGPSLGEIEPADDALAPATVAAPAGAVSAPGVAPPPPPVEPQEVVHDPAYPHLTMQYRDELQDVANRTNSVIILRDPNFKGQTLMAEGHATKSSHITAKPSETGPTAGFVAVEPRYTQLNQAEGRQAAAVRGSFELGCRAQQIFLSPARVAELSNPAAPDMRIDGTFLTFDTRDPQRIVGGHLTCSATYPHRGEVQFELRYNRTEDAFAVYETGTPGHRLLEPKPVMGLTNPLPPGATPGRFDAVCADYDLFAVHAPEEKSTDEAMRRYIDVPPRPFSPFTAMEREASNELLARERPVPEEEDHNLLNVNPLVRDAITEINRTVKASGGPHDVCHHSDEVGNPFSDHPGFPQFAFYPAGAESVFAERFPRATPSQPVLLADWDDLNDFNALSRAAGFTPPPNNPRWGEEFVAQGRNAPGVDREILRAANPAEIVGDTQPGSFERFQMVLRAMGDCERAVGENTIVKKPTALRLNAAEQAGRAVYLERIRPALTRDGGLDDIGRITADAATLDRVAGGLSEDDANNLRAYLAKARTGDDVAGQLMTIAGTVTALLGAVEGLVRDAPPDAPFAAEAGRALRDRLDNAVALLLEKTDRMALGANESDIDSMVAAKIAVTDMAGRHAEVRANLRSITEDVTSLVKEGYVLTTEKHAEARAQKAFRKAFHGELKQLAVQKRDTAKASVNEAWNLAHALAHRAEGRFGLQALNSDDQKIIDRANGLLAEAAPGATRIATPEEREARAAQGEAMLRDLRLKMLDGLNQSLGRLGMEVPEGVFDADGRPADDHRVAQFLQEVDALRAAVVSRQRPTRSLDILLQGSQAREQRHIQRTDQIAKATTLLASLGLTRGMMARENPYTAEVAAKGLMDPGEMRARLRAAQELASLDPRAMQPDQRNVDFEAERDDALRAHWQRHVAHVVRAIEDENLLGVKEHRDQTEKKPTWVGKALGKGKPQLEEADRVENKQVQLVRALLKAHQKTAKTIGLREPLSDERLARAMAPDLGEAERERESRRLIAESRKRSFAGTIRRGLQKAYAATIKPPDSEARFRGQVPNVGIGVNAGINLNNGAQTLQGDATLPFGGIIEGIVGHIALTTVEIDKLAKSYKALTPHGLQRADRAVTDQKAMGREMVQRWEEKAGPEDRMRSRVLLHLGEKIEGKADPTTARKVDKGVRFGLTLAGLAGGLDNVATITAGSALRTAGEAVPAALPLVGFGAVAVATVTTGVATGHQVRTAVRTGSFARTNDAALEMANRRQVRGLDPAAGAVPGGSQRLQAIPEDDESLASGPGGQGAAGIEGRAVDIAHHRLHKANRPGRAWTEAANLAGLTTFFGGSTATLYTFAAVGVGAAAASLTYGAAFGGIAGYFAATSAFRAGLQAKRDATRDALTDYLKDQADPGQLERLNKKAGIATEGAEPGSLKPEVVAEVLKREPELVTDILLAALRRELPPLTAEEMEAQVRRQAEMEALKADPNQAEGSAEARRRAERIEAKQAEIDAAAVARLTQSRTACYVIGLGADPEHVLAIADSYQTKAMDALCRELLNFTVKKVAQIDSGLKDGAYAGAR